MNIAERDLGILISMDFSGDYCKFNDQAQARERADRIIQEHLLSVSNPKKGLIFNLNELTYMDSTGTYHITDTNNKLKALGKEFYIVLDPSFSNGAKEINDLLEICGLNRIIPMYHDEKEILAQHVRQ